MNNSYVLLYKNGGYTFDDGNGKTVSKSFGNDINAARKYAEENNMKYIEV